MGGNLLDVEPMLGPLAENGGLVRTHALFKGSPAIDAATVASRSDTDRPEFDGRGEPFSRCVDGDGIDGTGPDIGAFEFQRE